MIAYLQGQVVPQDDESLILNVRGVGYEVLVSSFTRETIGALPSAQLWIHTHVREDQLTLFGFAQKAEKNLFLSLLKVNGIGPKVAMKILSGAPLHSIVQMIEDGDVKSIAKLPKVGKKTAEQLVLQLKGKLVLHDEQNPKLGFSARGDIISALVNLGFKLPEVEKVVDGMAPATEFEDGIKLGLQHLAGNF